jgi:chromatin remodeling complex protein RSC6
MPSTNVKKNAKSAAPAASAPAPVVAETAKKQTKEAKPAPVKKDSKKDSKKETPVVEKTVTPVSATTEEANVVVATDSTASVTANFGEFFGRFQKLLTEFGQLRTELKTLEKRTMKELKVVSKASGKRKKSGAARAPSGFVKPTKISDELASFLGKPFGSEMARTEVTREINAYIRSNNLQDKANGRKINPDSQLAKLLKVTDKDELTYFNLQRFMSPHFAKKADAVAVAVA